MGAADRTHVPNTPPHPSCMVENRGQLTSCHACSADLTHTFGPAARQLGQCANNDTAPQAATRSFSLLRAIIVTAHCLHRRPTAAV